MKYLINSCKLTITRLDQIKSINYIVRSSYGAGPIMALGSFKGNTTDMDVTMLIVGTTRKCKSLDSQSGF